MPLAAILHRRLQDSLLVALLLAITGCGAPMHYQWSSDGSRLAIHASKHQLFVTDAEGMRQIEFSVQQVNQELMEPIWHPDSRHLLITSISLVRDWGDAEKQLSSLEQRQWKWAASQVKSELLNYFEQSKEVIKHDQDVRIHQASPTLEALDGIGAHMVAKYLQAREPNSFGKDYPAIWNHWPQTTESLIRFEIALYQIDESKLTKVRTCQEVIGVVAPVSVSPSGKFLAFLKYDPFVEGDLKLKDDPQSFDLWVVPIDGSEEPRRVATSVDNDPTKFSCHWTNDERELIFVHASYPAHALGSQIVRAAMPFRPGHTARTGIDGNFDVEGIIQTGERNFPIRMLPDGRILFVAEPMSFPRRPDDLDSTPHLYVVDPKTPGPIVPLFEDKLPLTLALALENNDFAMSPAGDKLAVTSQLGVIWLLHLSTDQIETLQPEEYQLGSDEDSCPWYSLPSWRTNDELSFVVPPGSEHGSPNRPEIVLWSARGERCLSKNWPDAMLRNLLPAPP